MGDQLLMQMAGELRDTVRDWLVPEEVARHADLTAMAGAETASSSQGHSSIVSSREGCRRESGTGTMATPQCGRLY